MFSHRFTIRRRRSHAAASSLVLFAALVACSPTGMKGGSALLPRGPSSPPMALKYLRSFGSTGSKPGQFLRPQGISVDPSGNVYVADTGNHRVQKFDPQGRFIGEAGGFGWNPGRFNGPSGISAREGLNIYVVDSQNRRIQRFDRDLNFLSSLPSSEDEEGGLDFGFLRDVELASTGEIFVSDVENEQVLKLTFFGELERVFGGFADAPERLLAPAGLTVVRENAVYVADTGNDHIASYDAFGSYLGSLGKGALQDPQGVETDGHSYIYVADTGHHRLCIFSPQGEMLLSIGGSGDDLGSLRSPTDLAVSGMDQLYVLDSGNDRVQVFRIVRRADTGP
jgi:tripartite motif-containing protein 71